MGLVNEENLKTKEYKEENMNENQNIEYDTMIPNNVGLASDKKVSNGKLNLILIDKNFNAFRTSKFKIENIIKSLN